MRLASSGLRQRLGAHCDWCSWRAVDRRATLALVSPGLPYRIALRAPGRALRRMSMRRELLGGQSHGGFAGRLSDRESSALMNRNAVAKVWQREGVYSIAAVGSSDKVKEHWVL